jgi:hypothetical protein
LEVERQGPRLDIGEVGLYAECVEFRMDAPEAKDLRKPGKSWADAASVQVNLGRCVGVFFWQKRARSDEAHVASENVQALRKFIPAV